MELNLKGRHFLVTGGTRGIGRAIAMLLADEGADVSLCARDGAAVEEALAVLRRKGVNAFGRALDVADGAALARFIDDAAKSRGRLDGVIANASALAVGSDAAAFQQAFDVDLMHTRNAAEAALPWLEKSPGGAFVAISSISGSEDYGYGSVAYGTMKAALFFYVKSLARHWAPKGLRANIVSPGTTLFDGGHWHKVQVEQPDDFAATIAENPMGRMATPVEIANVAVFLMSPAAGFVSGANVVVDGTLTKRIPN